MENEKEVQTRPPVSSDMCHDEFDRWYWPVSLLKEFCRCLKVSESGTKQVLRERVKFVLEFPDKPIPQERPKRRKSRFNWAKEKLCRRTVILEDISFGPNVRRFFKTEIGSKFVCHSEFMDWMKSNAGATLDDAIDAWQLLEQRKEDPVFRREIAECNNYLQYLRDARNENHELSLSQAKKCWDYKKIRPAKKGIVVFEQDDLQALK